MGKLFLLLICAGALIYIGLPSLSKSEQGAPTLIERVTQTVTGKDPYPPSGIPAPKHGAQKLYKNVHLGEEDPHFAFDNSKGDTHCFIKFEDVSTRRVAAEFFCHPRKKIETRMLAGNYIIKIAFGRGTHWLDRKRLFGEKTEAVIFQKPAKLEEIPLGTTTLMSGGNPRRSRPGYLSIWTTRSNGGSSWGKTSPLPMTRW